MENPIMLEDTILLFDSYSPDSRRLHDSFRLAGCKCSAVILEENDFLPEGVLSVFDLFLGYYEKNGESPGKPRFFNE